MERLQNEDIIKILQRASEILKLPEIPAEAIGLIAEQIQGDARAAIQILELSAPDFSIGKIKAFLAGDYYFTIRPVISTTR